MTKGDGESDVLPSFKERLQSPSSGNWQTGRRSSSGKGDSGSMLATVRSSDLARIVGVLERYLSSVNARLLLERALRERNLTLDGFVPGDLAKIGGPLRRGVQLFVKEDRRKEALDEIAALCGSESVVPEPGAVVLSTEGDIVIACNQARRMCEGVGAKSFAMHKVMTIVSELGRNIVSYAGGGRIELSLPRNQTRRVVIRAVDEGPGIANLREILGGSYRSKTGLGKGLIGTKRLADRFDISTGAAGTVVVAEVLL